MTLNGLLAIAGILLAIIAIAGPVQRRSILLFAPRVVLFAALCAALLAVMFMRAAELWAIPFPKWSEFSLYALSFFAPILAAIACVACWHRAVLSEKNAEAFADVLDAAIKEGKYDEVERILRHNPTRLKVLPISTLHRVFDRKIVRALVDARSNLHLELLTSSEILEKADRSRFLFVDNVVRELVLSPNSPWRSAVLWEHGGHESWTYLHEDREIVERTLQNPKWYVQASAHMPLLMTAYEAVQSGRLDVDYNQIGRAYELRSGISPRADCPVFLGIKMEVLAIKAAVLARSEDDLYVTDLWNIFQVIRDHSRYDPAVWENSLANSDFPTPYAYLLHAIFYDLHRIIRGALSAAVPRTEGVTQEDIEALAQAAMASERGEDFEMPAKKEVLIAAPVLIDRQLAQVWSLCAWDMAHAKGKVGEGFRIGMIREYLDLVLQLHCQPSEIPDLGNAATSLEAWGGLFLGEIKQRFAGSHGDERKSLEEALWGLGRGKIAMNGRDWLAQQLGLSDNGS